MKVRFKCSENKHSLLAPVQQLVFESDREDVSNSGIVKTG